MRPRSFVFWCAPVAIVSLLGSISLRIHAQGRSQAEDTQSETSAPDDECRGNGCIVPLVDQAATKSAASAPSKPYNWKASFAEYKVGKVPRTADGHPNLQGIWSRTTLVPMERPRGQSKAEIDAESAAKAEDAAQQKQFDLRTEPTDTPPGEKTTDAYNTFWRDGYWFKVPMTSLRTSQVVDPPDGRLPPSTPPSGYDRIVPPSWTIVGPLVMKTGRFRAGAFSGQAPRVRRLPAEVPAVKNRPSRLLRVATR